MKSFYSISKGQLITLWVFGGVAFLWALENMSTYSHAEFETFVAWAVPLILVFYTIGWRKNQNSS